MQQSAKNSGVAAQVALAVMALGTYQSLLRLSHIWLQVSLGRYRASADSLAVARAVPLAPAFEPANVLDLSLAPAAAEPEATVRATVVTAEEPVIVRPRRGRPPKAK